MNNRSDGVHSASSECKRCGSTEVFLSRYRGVEGVVSAIFPCNVYRCLDCSRRFWGYEPFLRNSLRVYLWIGFISLILILIFLSNKLNNNELVVKNEAEFAPQFDSQAVDPGSEKAITREHLDTELTSVLSGVDLASKGLTDDLVELSEKIESQAEFSDVVEQSEQISTAQELSQSRLESAVVEDKEALNSLLKIDINYRIDSWRKAWESGISDVYLQFYSKDFIPNDGLSYKAWAAQRRLRVVSSKKIELSLSEFEVSFEEQNTRATALFTQDYSSPTYSESSRKELVFVNESGSWNIVSEQSLER